MLISKAHKKLIIRQFINNPTTSLSVLAMRIGQMICVDERDILRYLESVTVSSAFGRMLRNDVFRELEKEEEDGIEEVVRDKLRIPEQERRRDVEEVVRDKLRIPEQERRRDVEEVVRDKLRIPEQERRRDVEEVARDKLRIPEQERRRDGRAETKLLKSAHTNSEGSHTNFTHSRLIYHTFNTPYDQHSPYRNFATKWDNTLHSIHVPDKQPDSLVKRSKVGRRDYSRDYNAQDFTREYDTRVEGTRKNVHERKRGIDLKNCERLIVKDVDDDLVVDLLMVFNFVFTFYDELRIGENKEIRKSLQGETKSEKKGRRGRKKAVVVDDENEQTRGSADSTIDPFSGDLTVQQLILVIKNAFADLLLVLLRLVANERKAERLNSFREMVLRVINTFYADAEDNPLANTKRIQWFSKPLTAKNALLGVNSLFIDMKRVMELKNVVLLNSKHFSSRVRVLKFLVDVLLEGNAVRGMVSGDRNRQWEKKKSALKSEMRRLKSEIKMSKMALENGTSDKDGTEGAKGKKGGASKADTVTANDSDAPVKAELANQITALTEQFGTLSKNYNNLEIKCFKSRLNSELGQYNNEQLLYIDRMVVFIRDGAVYNLKRREIEGILEYVDEDTRGNLRLALMCVI